MTTTVSRAIVTVAEAENRKAQTRELRQQADLRRAGAQGGASRRRPERRGAPTTTQTGRRLPRLIGDPPSE